MGMAFLTKSGEGYLADAYFSSIQDYTRLFQADAAALLGQVVAHELGHLLLGPGHERHSIMRDHWKIDKLSGMRQHWQIFTEDEAERIKRKLQR